MLIAGVTGNILVCGTSTGRVTFSEVWSLEEIHYVDLHEHGAVRCLWFSEGEDNINVKFLQRVILLRYRSTVLVCWFSGRKFLRYY